MRSEELATPYKSAACSLFAVAQLHCCFYRLFAHLSEAGEAYVTSNDQLANRSAESSVDASSASEAGLDDGEAMDMDEGQPRCATERAIVPEVSTCVSWPYRLHTQLDQLKQTPKVQATHLCESLS